MKKILHYLFENCEVSYRTSADTLTFRTAERAVVISFKKQLAKSEESKVESMEISRHEGLRVFEHRTINNVTVSAIEYPGYREDLNTRHLPKSICFYLYALLRALVNYFDKTVDSSNIDHPMPKNIYKGITRHILSVNPGWGKDGEYSSADRSASPGCVFEISINAKYFENIDFFKHLLGVFPELPVLKPTEFYQSVYEKHQRIPDKKKIRLFETNTKARRIGYIKLLVDFISLNRRVSKSLINKKFEQYVTPYEDELKAHKNPKGLIKVSKSGISARPYVEVGEHIGILNYLNGFYTPGKDYKVYIQLLKEFGTDAHFEISFLDKIFWVEQILKHDFFYLTNLIELIFVCEPTNYAELKKNFQPYILKKLGEIKNQGNIPRRSIHEIAAIYKRIENWEKPEVYLEHVLMPRLNWLFDLDLINLYENLGVELTVEGKRLFENFCIWSDINCGRILTPDSFLERFSVHMVDYVYGEKAGNGALAEEEGEEVRDKIIEYIDESFEYFRTLAPNRVTLSQAINYTKYRLFLKDNLKVEFKDVLDFLMSNKQNTFVIMHQKKYNDGYIQKK
jgi:hypothetical protein